MTYILLLLAYIAASVASQFLTSTPIELFTISGVDIWIPLSALTLVPLVDVLRSFTQDAAEKHGMTFKQTAKQMLTLSLGTSAFCVAFAGLPLPIFVGVLLAVTIGGAVDILIFRKVGKWFTNPVTRMCFSNAAATLVGSGIVFFVAFTDLIFANNSMARPLHEVTVGWLTQSTFIWAAGLVIGYGIQFVKALFVRK
ncbi:MAG: hypothetical protein ACRDCE_20390 [Cetobacterium sp.]|uniref:hypothetical protein n=1 Tax=Cetobacterium sp. TaxID=2071632 RepID=UPI003EE69092